MCHLHNLVRELARMKTYVLPVGRSLDPRESERSFLQMLDALGVLQSNKIKKYELTIEVVG